MKSLKVLACIAVAVFMMSGTVLAMPTDWTNATTFRIQDNYVGGSLDQVNDVYEHNRGDVISNAGSENLFDIDWMDIYYLDNYLRVDIHTDYVAGTEGTAPTTYGDLFISTDGWNPFGDSPYLQDTIANGEKWEYAFDVSSGNLYDITNAQGSILTSDDVMPSEGYQYRNNQEVLINNAGLTSIGTGTAGRSGEYYSMVMDVTGMNLDFASLLSSNNVGFHWAMTCGNDVIEGSTPEPGTMLLLGSGLLGLLGYRRRFKK